MPGSGINALWNESSPADVDNAGAGAGVIRSLETSIRNVMAVEHNWPSATGTNFGYHLLGSCRPFYDVQSNVSSAGTDSRLMLTSDSSRLFHVGNSSTTCFLGSPHAIEIGPGYNGMSPPGKFHWVMEVGTATKTSTGAGTVTIPNSGYSGSPYVQASVATTAAGAAQAWVVIQGITATAFNWQVFDQTGGTPTSSGILWFSLGTRTF